MLAEKNKCLIIRYDYILHDDCIHLLQYYIMKPYKRLWLSLDTQNELKGKFDLLIFIFTINLITLRVGLRRQFIGIIIQYEHEILIVTHNFESYKKNTRQWSRYDSKQDDIFWWGLYDEAYYEIYERVSQYEFFMLYR